MSMFSMTGCGQAHTAQLLCAVIATYEDAGKYQSLSYYARTLK